MAYESYDALVSSMSEVQEDNNAEYVTYTGTSIRLAQDRLRKELAGDAFRTNVDITCSVGSRLISKPAGYRFTYNAFLVTPSTGRETQLYHQPDDFLRNYWDVPTSTGVPKYFATDYSNSTIMLAPTPDAAYIVKANVQADLAYLSANNQTNYLTQYYGQELYYASMVEQMAFSKDLDKKNMWENSYQNAIQGANNEASREDQPDGETKIGMDSQNILKIGQVDRT